MAIYFNNNGTARRMDGAGDGSLYAPVTSIATPENGATASKPYDVGEMFIRNGKLCTCTVPIGSGGSFAKDTNYGEGDVGSVLTQLNSNKMSYPQYRSDASYYSSQTTDIYTATSRRISHLMLNVTSQNNIDAPYNPIYVNGKAILVVNCKGLTPGYHHIGDLFLNTGDVVTSASAPPTGSQWLFGVYN